MKDPRKIIPNTKETNTDTADPYKHPLLDRMKFVIKWDAALYSPSRWGDKRLKIHKIIKMIS